MLADQLKLGLSDEAFLAGPDPRHRDHGRDAVRPQHADRGRPASVAPTRQGVPATDMLAAEEEVFGANHQDFGAACARSGSSRATWCSSPATTTAPGPARREPHAPVPGLRRRPPGGRGARLVPPGPPHLDYDPAVLDYLNLAEKLGEVRGPAGALEEWRRRAVLTDYEQMGGARRTLNRLKNARGGHRPARRSLSFSLRAAAQQHGRLFSSGPLPALGASLSSAASSRRAQERERRGVGGHPLVPERCARPAPQPVGIMSARGVVHRQLAQMAATQKPHEFAIAPARREPLLVAGPSEEHHRAGGVPDGRPTRPRVKTMPPTRSSPSRPASTAENWCAAGEVARLAATPRPRDLAIAGDFRRREPSHGRCVRAMSSAGVSRKTRFTQSEARSSPRRAGGVAAVEGQPHGGPRPPAPSPPSGTPGASPDSGSNAAWTALRHVAIRPAMRISVAGGGRSPSRYATMHAAAEAGSAAGSVSPCSTFPGREEIVGEVAAAPRTRTPMSALVRGGVSATAPARPSPARRGGEGGEYLPAVTGCNVPSIPKRLGTGRTDARSGARPAHRRTCGSRRRLML